MEERLVTADDLIRGGACVSGVIAGVRRHAKKIAAAMPVSAVLRLTPRDDRKIVMRALEQDGYGDGYGYGYGSGYGDGDGYGDGYGSGYG